MYKKNVVIGAGITGLSFANEIKREDYIIIEKENSAGGYCRTIKKDGFVWDYAGHFFHFNNKKLEIEFTEKVKKFSEIHTVVKKTKIYYKGNLIDFPFQQNIHQLPFEEFIDCLYDLVVDKPNNVQSFKDMLIANYGNAIASKFLIPYNEKLYACDVSELDVNSMGRFFPHSNIKDIILNFKNSNNTSYNNTFIYPKEGAESFVKVLLEETNKNILFNEELINIDTIKKEIHTKNYIINYSNLISTIPFNLLLNKVGINENNKVWNYNKVVVFNLGFDLKSNNDMHWCYFSSNEQVFYRVGFYDNILSLGKMSLYVEVGLKPDDEVNEELLLKEILNNLADVGIIEKHNLVSHSMIVMNPAYVHITEESKMQFEKLSFELEKESVYTIGRYGKWTYNSIEDNIIDARLLAKRLS